MQTLKHISGLICNVRMVGTNCTPGLECQSSPLLWHWLSLGSQMVQDKLTQVIWEEKARQKYESSSQRGSRRRQTSENKKSMNTRVAKTIRQRQGAGQGLIHRYRPQVKPILDKHINSQHKHHQTEQKKGFDTKQTETQMLFPAVLFCQLVTSSVITNSFA